MHPYFKETAVQAGASITHVPRPCDTQYQPKTLEIFEYAPNHHVAVDPDNPSLHHIFTDGLLNNIAHWAKYPREFPNDPPQNYIGRYICLDTTTNHAQETIFDEFVKQKHHNFQYQVRTKRFQFPLSPDEERHPDTQTYTAPSLYKAMMMLLLHQQKQENPNTLDITSPPSKLIPNRVHRFDKQRTVNNTYTYVEKHIKHANIFVQKYKSYGVPMFPSPYISRLKETGVGLRTQKLLFTPKLHNQIRSVTYLNDHTSGATMVVVNWPIQQHGVQCKLRGASTACLQDQSQQTGVASTSCVPSRSGHDTTCVQTPPALQTPLSSPTCQSPTCA